MSLNTPEINICYQYVSEIKKNIKEMKYLKYEYNKIKEIKIYENFTMNTKIGQGIDNNLIEINNKLEKTIKSINELTKKTEEYLYTKKQENNNISQFGGDYYE